MGKKKSAKKSPVQNQPKASQIINKKETTGVKADKINSSKENQNLNISEKKSKQAKNPFSNFIIPKNDSFSLLSDNSTGIEITQMSNENFESKKQSDEEIAGDEKTIETKTSCNEEVANIEPPELSLLDDFFDKTIVVQKKVEEETQASKIDWSFLKKQISREISENDVLENYKDSSNVYMQTVLHLFENMNIKVNEILQKKSLERILLEECYKSHLSNDYENIGKILNKTLNYELTNQDKITHFINFILLGDIESIKNLKENIKNEISSLKNSFFSIFDIANDLTGENKRLKNIINKMNNEYEEKNNKLVADNLKLKDGLFEIISRYIKVENQLESDLLEETKKVLEAKDAEIEKLNQEMEKNNEISKKLKNEAEKNNVKYLNQQINNLKEENKQLQKDNLTITKSMQKLTENNYKYSNDLVLFNNEIKKLISSDKIKTETILRQKSLIEMFQAKICNEVSPIEKLKRKKEELENKLKEESDYLRKQRILKEKDDCEKRLSDFLKIAHYKK
ncbi:hypothetical protein NUSPORA_00937 [Nucleospora cyclopteri]